MKIGVDIDDVLCDSFEFFIPYINKKYSTNLTLEDFFSWNVRDVLLKHNVPEEEVKDAFLHFLDEKVEDFSLFENAKEALGRLKEEHELIIMTSRDLKTKEGTINWLNSHFGEDFFDGFVFIRENNLSKIDYCVENSFDFLIEDSPSEIKEALEKPFPIIVMDRSWNRKFLGEKLFRVKNWLEIETFIKDKSL